MANDVGAIPEAVTRHPEVFEILYLLRDKLCAWIDHGDLAAPQSPLEWVRVACAVRTYNIFKATISLLEKDFWEDGLILVRTLFELLLNVEELDRVEGESQKRATRYMIFEKLQIYLRHVAEREYHLHSGRSLKHPEKLKDLDARAERLFASFITGRKQGKIKWAKSWHGRTVSELAEASKSTMRKWHYKTLYAYCSSFVHATPASVFSANTFCETQAELDNFLPAKLEADKEGIIQTVSFLCLFTMELFVHVASVIPKFDPVEHFAVMESIFRLHGVTPPARPRTV